jgi:hypothetical protein
VRGQLLPHHNLVSSIVIEKPILSNVVHRASSIVFPESAIVVFPTITAIIIYIITPTPGMLGIGDTIVSVVIIPFRFLPIVDLPFWPTSALIGFFTDEFKISAAVGILISPAGVHRPYDTLLGHLPVKIIP